MGNGSARVPDNGSANRLVLSVHPADAGYPRQQSCTCTTFHVARQGENKAEDGYHLQAGIARMARHRDLAGEYDWIAVDCDRKGAPMPVFVKHEWPATHELSAFVAEAAQWMLNTRRPQIAAASGLGPTDAIVSVLRSLLVSQLLTEDLEAAK